MAAQAVVGDGGNSGVGRRAFARGVGIEGQVCGCQHVDMVKKKDQEELASQGARLDPLQEGHQSHAGLRNLKGDLNCAKEG